MDIVPRVESLYSYFETFEQKVKKMCGKDPNYSTTFLYDSFIKLEGSWGIAEKGSLQERVTTLFSMIFGES